MALTAWPWGKAVVRREFPNRLQVVLQEHQAVAYWGSDSELRLINSYGEVFEANVGEVEAEMLPQLDGPEGQAADGAQLRSPRALPARGAGAGGRRARGAADRWSGSI